MWLCAEAEVSAHRLEVGLLQRLLHAPSLSDRLPLVASDRRCDQIRGVIGLRTVKRRPQPGYFLR